MFLSPERVCQNNRDVRIGERGIMMCQGICLRNVALMLNSGHKLQYDLTGKKQRSIVIPSKMHRSTFLQFRMVFIFYWILAGLTIKRDADIIILWGRVEKDHGDIQMWGE